MLRSRKNNRFIAFKNLYFDSNFQKKQKIESELF